MEEGGSFDFTVDPNTGEMTVIDVVGDVVITNEDGTTTNVEVGSNLGIMHDEGPGPYDGPGPGDDYDGQGHYDGPGPDDGYDGPGPDDGPPLKDGEEGTFTDPDGGTFTGTYTDTESGGIYEGTYTDEFGTYTGTFIEDGSDTGIFTGTFTDSEGGTFTGTFTDSGFTGTYTDPYGNVYNITDFYQSSFFADEGFVDNSSSHPGTPTTWDANEIWDTRQNAYTDNVFGKDSSNNDIVAPGLSTTKDTGTAPFFENFNSGSDNFAVIHTGFGSNENSGFLEKVFNFTTSETRQITFDYNFITTEFGGSNPPDDEFLVEMHKSNGETITLARESVLSSTLTSVSGLPFDTLDNDTGGETGWIRFDNTAFIPSGVTKLHFSYKRCTGQPC